MIGHCDQDATSATDMVFKNVTNNLYHGNLHHTSYIGFALGRTAQSVGVVSHDPPTPPSVFLCHVNWQERTYHAESLNAELHPGPIKTPLFIQFIVNLCFHSLTLLPGILNLYGSLVCFWRLCKCCVSV